MTLAFNYGSLPLQIHRCPLCDGDAFDTLARCDRYRFGVITVGCRRCGLVQTNPVPDPEALREFYEHHYRALYQAVQRPDERYIGAFGKRERMMYTADFVNRQLHLSDRSLLLDFGCGEGSLFAALREVGYVGRLEGVEADPEFRAYAARLGDARVHDSLEVAREEGGRYNGVVVNHVLEHFIDPVALLNSLRDLLCREGLLYVDVPDAEHYSSVNDLHIAHVIHFTRDTLLATLEKAGFEVRTIELHAPPHHPRSLRAVAAKSDQVTQMHGSRAEMDSSVVAWRAIRSIQRRYWLWRLRRRLADAPGARSAWRSLRRWASIRGSIR